MPSAALLPHLALFFGCALWASSFIALKIAFTVYDPMVVMFGRMTIAALIMAPVFRYTRNYYRPGDWKALLFMAFCEPCLYFVFEALALERTSASQAGMAAATLPLIVAVGAHYLLKESISRKVMLGFLLAVSGVAWLSAGAVVTENAPDPVMGNILEVLAMVCASGYMLTAKKLSTRYSPLFLTAVQATVGSVFFLPIMALPSTELPTQFVLLPALCIVFLGAGITFGAYFLYNYGNSKLKAYQATAYTNLIPVITLILGTVILKDTLTLQQYAASALVLMGVFLSQEKGA